jgi:hypothetical protein
MTKRESIIEKIKALLAKTVQNGCTEAEMMTALGMAQALQDTYIITTEELQLARCTSDEGQCSCNLHADPDRLPSR